MMTNPTTPKAKPKARRKAKRSDKSTGQTTGMVKVPQPHGGALNAGGTPGNPGGGRRPDHIRQLATEVGYDEAIPALRKIIADTAATKGEIVSACKAVLDMVPRKDEVNTSDEKRQYELMRKALIDATFDVTQDPSLADQILKQADVRYQASITTGTP